MPCALLRMQYKIEPMVVAPLLAIPILLVLMILLLLIKRKK